MSTARCTGGAGHDEMLDVLTESWVGSIGRH